MSKILAYLRDESGASAAEYALILAIVGAGIAGVMVGLANAINQAFTNASAAITNSQANNAQNP